MPLKFTCRQSHCRFAFLLCRAPHSSTLTHGFLYQAILSQLMHKKKKGDASDPLDVAVHGEDGSDDFAREAADAAAFAQTLADLEGDEEADEPILDGDDQELDSDREAADDEELEGLDEKAPELTITQQDIREGILAIEKVPYSSRR